MIDNYDSFTFNLVHYFQALKQNVLVFRNDEITIEEIKDLAPNTIVISPGPGNPDNAGISLELIKNFAGIIPILGVCLGHQCIAQYYGANIERAKKIMHGKTSLISHNKQELFNQLQNPLQVTRYHSLIVNKETLPPELEITAWSTNEKNRIDEIMAIKHKKLAVMGVQFHPESILTEQGHVLLANFLNVNNAMAQ